MWPTTIKGSSVDDAQGPRCESGTADRAAHSADGPRQSADDGPVVTGCQGPCQASFRRADTPPSLDQRPGVHPTFTGRRCCRRCRDRKARKDGRDETQTPPAPRARQHIEAEGAKLRCINSAHSRFVRGRIDAGAVSGSVRVSDATTSPARSRACDRPMRDRQAARAPSTP